MSDTGDLEQQEQGVGGGTQDNDTGDPLGSSSGNNQQNDYYNPVTAAESGAGFGLSIVPEDPVDSSWDRGRALEKVLEDEIAQHQPVQSSLLGFGSNQSQQPQETVDSTNLEGASSDSPSLNHENAQNQQALKKPKAQPILSVMNLKGKPGYEKACIIQMHAWTYIKETQGGRIPSFMDRDQYSGDELSGNHTGPRFEEQDVSCEP